MKNPIVVAELQRIAEAHDGLLQPRVVVDEARPLESPLHGHFEWDDSVASESWRLHQARNLINVVVTSYRGGAEAPMFVSLTTDRREDGAGYRVMATVLSDEDLRAQLLIDAKQEMLRFKSRYRTLVELAAVFAAMDTVVVAVKSEEGQSVSA